MNSLKQSLKKLVSARWFPTVSKPVLSGLAASGIVYGLHAAGVTSFTTWEVNSAIAPVVGLLVAAIVTKEKQPPKLGTIQVQTTVATHTADYKPEATIGKTIAATFLDPIAAEIDKDPTLVNEIAGKALERVLNPAQTAAAEALIDGLFKRNPTPPGTIPPTVSVTTNPPPRPEIATEPAPAPTFQGRGADANH